MDLIELPEGTFTRHPYELARARFFADVLQAAGLVAAPIRILDVGSGDGFLARQLGRRLPRGSSVVCFDIHYSDTFLASPPRLEGEPITFTRTRPDGAFDLLLLLDVAEHVPDDHGFLSDLVAENLRSGGHVLVSVPAYMALFTGHDLRLRHYRRYTPARLRGLVRDSGLTPILAGGLFHSLLLPRAFQKAVELLRGVRSSPDPETEIAGESGAASWRAGPLLTALTGGALWLDNAVSGVAARVGLVLPGLSTWTLARKP